MNQSVLPTARGNVSSTRTSYVVIYLRIPYIIYWKLHPTILQVAIQIRRLSLFMRLVNILIDLVRLFVVRAID